MSDTPGTKAFYGGVQIVLRGIFNSETIVAKETLNMERKTKLNRQLFLIMVTVLLLCISAALLTFTILNSRRITHENQEYLKDTASQTAESIDSAISDGFDNIRILSQLVSKSLTGPEFDISEMQGLIQNSVFDFMEFADVNGMDHNITGGVSDARDRQYYLDAKTGNTGMELIYDSRATHETLLMFYSPIYFENQFVGSLVGVYQTANRITDLLSNTYFDEPATSYLATDEGRIIASNQGFDPQKEVYISDFVQGNADAEALLETALQTGETVILPVEENATGACMIRLKDSGWYVIQLFPQQVSSRMMSSANRLGYMLVGVMLIISSAIVLFLVVFYNSQRRQVEAAMIQAKNANQAKTNFLFNMSHDIRTPMNAILGFTDMAKKSMDDPVKLMDCLNKTHQAGKLLLSLINSVLEMSRIESGKAVLDENPCSIVYSFLNVDVTMQELAKAKDIALNFEFGDIQDIYIYADFDRTNRIFINIISNAIKYTENGGHVRVRCEQIGRRDDEYGLYRYTFEDNGIGMSEEFQKHLFDEFSRENSSTASGIEGSGLGLSVAKSFVELMHGTIEFNSIQGEGTTFIVTLPFRIQNDVETAKYTDPITGKTIDVVSSGEGEKDISFAGKRFLIVEDNDMNREIAGFILSEENILFEEANDGTVAVELLKEKGPDYYDAILMDIQMPTMDGYEATKAIRAMYPEAKLPIIALSANAFAEDKAASLEAGMNGHIAKPINTMELFENLSSLTLRK